MVVSVVAPLQENAVSGRTGCAKPWLPPPLEQLKLGRENSCSGRFGPVPEQLDLSRLVVTGCAGDHNNGGQPALATRRPSRQSSRPTGCKSPFRIKAAAQRQTAGSEQEAAASSGVFRGLLLQATGTNEPGIQSQRRVISSGRWRLMGECHCSAGETNALLTQPDSPAPPPHLIVHLTPFSLFSLS